MCRKKRKRNEQLAVKKAALAKKVRVRAEAGGLLSDVLARRRWAIFVHLFYVFCLTIFQARKDAKAKRADIFKRAESYVREYRAQVRRYVSELGFSGCLVGWASVMFVCVCVWWWGIWLDTSLPPG